MRSFGSSCLLVFRVSALVSALALIFVSCRDGEETAPVGPPSTKTTPAPPAEGDGVTFFADDWQEAKRLAQQSGKLIFIDAWAPWGHTCWSMKRAVLHDPSLRAFADRVLFVEIDTDKPQNAAFAARFPVRVWPTFFVIDARSDVIVKTQGGSMSLAETRAFLEAALHKTPEGPADAALLEGYRLLQAGEPAQAAKRFEVAAQLEGPRTDEAIAAWLRALRQARDFAGCATAGASAITRVRGSAAQGDHASMMLLCASELPDGEPKSVARTLAHKKLEELVARPAAGASVDDQGDVLGNLAELYEELGKKDDARALHERRLKLLEEDAHKATTPLAARVHDYARMNSYLALGQGERAVTLLSERTLQLPDDYEAHARLASALFQTGRIDDARIAAARAVALSYGPRRLRYLQLQADIERKSNRLADERQALERLLQENAALAEVQRNAELATKAGQRLGELQQPR